jgi:hypothetical protein
MALNAGATRRPVNDGLSARGHRDKDVSDYKWMGGGENGDWTWPFHNAMDDGVMSK